MNPDSENRSFTVMPFPLKIPDQLASRIYFTVIYDGRDVLSTMDIDMERSGGRGRRLTVESRCSCSRKYFNLALIPPAASRAFRSRRDFRFLRSHRESKKVLVRSMSGRQDYKVKKRADKPRFLASLGIT